MIKLHTFNYKSSLKVCSVKQSYYKTCKILSFSSWKLFLKKKKRKIYKTVFILSIKVSKIIVPKYTLKLLSLNTRYTFISTFQIGTIIKSINHFYFYNDHHNIDSQSYMLISSYYIYKYIKLPFLINASYQYSVPIIIYI